ncbi:hypothetical protein GCM10022416_30520 [Actinomadura keratinilytica]|uniref:Uncharacterized protein n=1 Tax=Actinomadura keratinilytica TaxID=547461 RepID=A0ABP7YVG4_9ACTN
MPPDEPLSSSPPPQAEVAARIPASTAARPVLSPLPPGTRRVVALIGGPLSFVKRVWERSHEEKTVLRVTVNGSKHNRYVRENGWYATCGSAPITFRK